MDKGSRLSPVLPEKWTLVCRDAFNGIILWQRSLPTWHTHWWPVKSGPTQAMRRLVALDDRLYLPLGAGDTLFLAGPPDVLDETRLHGRFLQPEVVKQIEQQQDAVDGRLGGILWAVSAKDGTRVYEKKLNAVPVFDGLIAANEKLPMSTIDGRVICYK